MVNKLCLKYKHFICLEFDLISLRVYSLLIYEFNCTLFIVVLIHPQANLLGILEQMRYITRNSPPH